MTDIKSNTSITNWNDWSWHMKQKSQYANPEILASFGITEALVKQRKRVGLTPYNIQLLIDLKKNDTEGYKAELLQSFLPLFGQKKRKHQWSWAKRHDLIFTKMFEHRLIPKFFRVLFTGRGSDTEVRSLENMYPNTDVIIATSTCARHCSFCFREVGDSTGEASRLTGDMNVVLNAVKTVIERKTSHVLITGGDPLTRSNEQLRQILAPLVESDSVQVLRLATRMVVDLPMRFYDQKLLAMLTDFANQMRQRNASFRIVTHVNHPSELTEEALVAIRNIQNCGIEILNQTALLRGVNDDAKTLQTLFMKLDQLGIKNHKIFHSMPVEGTDHLRVSVRRFRNLLSRLHQWLPGTSVPQANLVTLVGKIPILPKGRWIIPIPFTNRFLVRSFRGEWFLFRDVFDWIRTVRELGTVVSVILACLFASTLFKQEGLDIVSNDSHVVKITNVIQMTKEFDYPDSWMRSFPPFVDENGVLYQP